MTADNKWASYEIDARTFQKQLGSLGNTIALKVEREGPKILPKPTFVSVDIYIMLRQTLAVYDLFFFINADKRRNEDVDWKVAYSAAILPLIRCMIDCLYNITAILNNPGPKGYQFRESGYKKILETLDADEKRYGGDPKWDAYIAKRRAETATVIGVDGLTMDEIKGAKSWPTLGRYLRVKSGTVLTPHQGFLKRLTFGFWQEYSGMAHATYQGLLATAYFFTPDNLPREERPRFETEVTEGMISMSIFRVAAILLCTLTEVQACFRFDGARINQRLCEVWNALLRASEIRELYDERYMNLMKERGISPE
jgi:hypothetical protein